MHLIEKHDVVVVARPCDRACFDLLPDQAVRFGGVCAVVVLAGKVERGKLRKMAGDFGLLYRRNFEARKSWRVGNVTAVRELDKRRACGGVCSATDGS